jgi:hypothetical protein
MVVAIAMGLNISFLASISTAIHMRSEYWYSNEWSATRLLCSSAHIDTASSKVTGFERNGEIPFEWQNKPDATTLPFLSLTHQNSKT